MRDHDKYLKELVKQLEQHRKDDKGIDGNDIKACNDERVFCPFEKDKLISLIKGIVIDLKEFGEWKEKMEKEKGGR